MRRSSYKGSKEGSIFCIISKFEVICTNTSLDYFPKEVKVILDDFVDTNVDELPSKLPHVRSISHHMDLIPRASLPDKPAYKMNPK